MRTHNGLLEKNHTVWAELYLADMETVIKFDLDQAAKTFTDQAGETWRSGFEAYAFPHGSKKFVIWMFKGSSTEDLRNAEQMIAEAKRGNLRFWEEYTQTTGAPGLASATSIQTRQVQQHADVLRPCGVSACSDAFHSWRRGEQDDPCRTEAIRHPDGCYEVRGWRYYGEEWAADVTNFEDCFPAGPAGLKVIRDLANDYSWVQGECDRLNEMALQEVGA